MTEGDAAIVVPIRFSSILFEPQVGYYNGDFEQSSTAPASTDGYSVGFGLFGYRNVGENLSVHYGARLADVSETSSSLYRDPAGTPLIERESELDGYYVTPSVGFHYALSRVTIGAEIGWEYREEEWKTTYTLLVPPTVPSGNVPVAGFFGVGGISEAALDSSTVSRGTVARVVFRYFFGPN